MNILFNAHLGSNWTDRLDLIIKGKREKYRKEIKLKKNNTMLKEEAIFQRGKYHGES